MNKTSFITVIWWITVLILFAMALLGFYLSAGQFQEAADAARNSIKDGADHRLGMDVHTMLAGKILAQSTMALVGGIALALLPPLFIWTTQRLAAVSQNSSTPTKTDN